MKIGLGTWFILSNVTDEDLKDTQFVCTVAQVGVGKGQVLAYDNMVGENESPYLNRMFNKQFDIEFGDYPEFSQTTIDHITNNGEYTIEIVDVEFKVKTV